MIMQDWHFEGPGGDLESFFILIDRPFELMCDYDLVLLLKGRTFQFIFFQFKAIAQQQFIPH